MLTADEINYIWDEKLKIIPRAKNKPHMKARIMKALSDGAKYMNEIANKNPDVKASYLRTTVYAMNSGRGYKKVLGQTLKGKFYILPEVKNESTIHRSNEEKKGTIGEG